MSKKPPLQIQNLRRVRLPFQYTDEGRAQIKAQQEERSAAWARAMKIDNRASPLDPLPSDYAPAFPLPSDYAPAFPLPDFATKVPVTQGRVYASAFNLYSDDRRFVQQHASYLQPLIENIDTVVSKFRDKMRTVDYDTLIGTGLSGALAVPTLARAVGCSWAIVRKDGDGSHSGNAVEGTVGRRWVFVDDLISTGQTRLRVRESMAQFSVDNNFDTEYVGDYLYYGNQFRPKENGNV